MPSLLVPVPATVPWSWFEPLPVLVVVSLPPLCAELPEPEPPAEPDSPFPADEPDEPDEPDWPEAAEEPVALVDAATRLGW